MTRFYVQLNKSKDGEILRRESVTQETIIEKIKFMLRPYTVRSCERLVIHSSSYFYFAGQREAL